MKKTFGFLTAALVAFSLNAQTSGQVATYTTGVGAQTDGLYNYAMGAISDKLEKLSYEDSTIEGSPYKANTFMPTQLYYGDEAIGQVYYRYNAHNQEIETKQQNLDQEPIRALGRDKKIKLMVDGKPMSFKTFIDKSGNTQNGYLTLLRDGKYKLYKRLNIVFKDAKKAPNSFVKGTPARFTPFTEYYLESEDGKRIDEIELNTKKFLNVVGSENRESVKQFIKENKIKLKDEQDVYAILTFLNS
ncbi:MULTISPECIES: hypothetical protein [Croceitalea]|uniref:Uncharacterized protein n=1 Tax=Croceitalea vernalis TaxID=3075599 RepID=A0ABU3BJR0_9FLAO|nr:MULTISPECIES: hypothetical protein [unclassified Croceitalea]MDT0540551.1 hypothetical protein [Croceitalea sp. P059]MDT0622407.1 hypothetical protein [Croceitalea sp. P007]